MRERQKNQGGPPFTTGALSLYGDHNAFGKWDKPKQSGFVIHNTCRKNTWRALLLYGQAETGTGRRYPMYGGQMWTLQTSYAEWHNWIIRTGYDPCHRPVEENFGSAAYLFYCFTNECLWRDYIRISTSFLEKQGETTAETKPVPSGASSRRWTDEIAAANPSGCVWGRQVGSGMGPMWLLIRSTAHIIHTVIHKCAGRKIPTGKSSKVPTYKPARWHELPSSSWEYLQGPWRIMPSLSWRRKSVKHLEEIKRLQPWR